MADFLFYVAALVAVLTALGVVAAKNPVMSVTSLLGCFFSVSMIYLLSGFQFIAAIQIMVYAGAIMVLFLFVVMLLNLGDQDVASQIEMHLGEGPHAKAAMGVAVGMMVLSLIAILSSRFEAVDPGLLAAGNDPIPELAEAMFTHYSLPFEAASVLLLATAVGVMVLAKRQRSAKTQGPGSSSPTQPGSVL